MNREIMEEIEIGSVLPKQEAIKRAETSSSPTESRVKGSASRFGLSKNQLFTLATLAFLLIILPAALLLTQKNQENRKLAAVPLTYPVTPTPTKTPSCSSLAQVTLSSLNTSSLKVVASSSIPYVNVELRITDKSGIVTPYQNPLVQGNYSWVWTISKSLSQIASATFYTDVRGLGQGGLFCGTWMPKPTPTPTIISHAPVITTTGLPSGRVKRLYTTYLYANDRGNDIIEASVDGLPEGLKSLCNAFPRGARNVSCHISGTPTKSGNYTLKFSVKDKIGAVTSKNFPLVIRP